MFPDGELGGILPNANIVYGYNFLPRDISYGNKNADLTDFR